MFVLRREQGRLAEVEELIRDAADRYPGYRSFRCFIPLLDWELGREEDARRHFDELATDDFASLPRDSEWLFCLSILAEVAAYLDDRKRAAVLYRLLEPYGHLNAMASGEVAIGAVARPLGILATTTRGHGRRRAPLRAGTRAERRRAGAGRGAPTRRAPTPACCWPATSRATWGGHTS